MAERDRVDRRELAAAHRRRGARSLAALAAAAALAGIIVGAESDGDEPASVAEIPFCRDESPGALVRVAGQGVVVRMGGTATGELLAGARAGEIGGVVLFPPPEIAGDRLRAQISRIQAAAAAGGNPPLLIAIDQEGGVIERLPALAPQLSPYTIAQNDDRADAVLEGRAAGFQLRDLGINVNLAPVLDVPASTEQFMTPRAFGSTPEQVARLGLAFALGQQREGVAATAKHFPGLGRAVENTDFAPTEIDASARALESDLWPFAAAVEAGVRLVMVGHASYPSLGARGPAALSAEIVQGLLRERLGFTGVVITDDLLAAAVSIEHPPRRAAVLAAAAGNDLLLFAAEPTPGIARELARAAGAGELGPEALRLSCERVGALKQAFATRDGLR